MFLVDDINQSCKYGNDGKPKVYLSFVNNHSGSKDALGSMKSAFTFNYRTSFYFYEVHFESNNSKPNGDKKTARRVKIQYQGDKYSRNNHSGQYLSQVNIAISFGITYKTTT